MSRKISGIVVGVVVVVLVVAGGFWALHGSQKAQSRAKTATSQKAATTKSTSKKDEQQTSRKQTKPAAQPATKHVDTAAEKVAHMSQPQIAAAIAYYGSRIAASDERTWTEVADRAQAGAGLFVYLNKFDIENMDEPGQGVRYAISTDDDLNADTRYTAPSYTVDQDQTIHYYSGKALRGAPIASLPLTKIVTSLNPEQTQAVNQLAQKTQIFDRTNGESSAVKTDKAHGSKVTIADIEDSREFKTKAVVFYGMAHFKFFKWKIDSAWNNDQYLVSYFESNDDVISVHSNEVASGVEINVGDPSSYTFLKVGLLAEGQTNVLGHASREQVLRYINQNGGYDAVAKIEIKQAP
ncbi:hypothetical protein LPAF129_09110 [Ligilactobacillus pabuli]|uniref:Lipoprotein n=1 Tax=Ligilactobacillus pabuli TaxID=2886039 RepID=A0ABQ5JJY3_9LACO|nr:hypothetical protein [Ligilactobacillus pabuli]GKS81225.1 hypothetical protein LPAF129_09110 [Ligilactobacillus pabuli]